MRWEEAGKPRSPPRQDKSTRLEADFTLQGRIVTVTSLEAGCSGVAVIQARQVFVPRARKRDVPRQAVAARRTPCSPAGRQPTNSRARQSS